MKTYTMASNAARAAKAALSTKLGINKKEVAKGEHFTVVANEDNTCFFWSEIVNEPVVGNFIYCPECGIHLSNGISDYATQCEVAAQYNSKAALIKHEYLCLACSNEFGELVKETSKTSISTGKGIKIQKDRPEQNGVTRPSQGGKTSIIWEYLDATLAATGTPATKKQAVEENPNSNSCMVINQYYSWRKFNGYRGRL